MPLLTVVVAAHGTQGYLRECLDSILEQPLRDLELIAIDDASPDHCPRILDEYAERDARVRVLHLGASVGLGPARDIGLDHATGDYVWFVGASDAVARDALPAIGAVLRSTQPDLLLVDHDRVDWLGRHSPSASRELLGDGRSLISLAEQPRLFDVLPAAWNKIIRRTLMTRTGLRFLPGWYEDVPFSYPVLVLAERIATLRRVCYHYHQRRTVGERSADRHFDAIDQWSRTWRLLDAVGVRAAQFYPAILARMVWHLLAVLGHRVPAPRRREFFRRVHRLYRERQRPGMPLPKDAASLLRCALIAGDHYWIYRALRPLRPGGDRGTPRDGGRDRGARLGERLRQFWSNVGFWLYPLMRLAPVEARLAAYAASHYRGFGGDPAAIFAQARELRPDIRGTWIVDRGHRDRVPAGVPYVVEGTLSYYWLLARARYLVNDVNFPGFVVRRGGTLHIQTHHGTPVAAMGADRAAYPIGEAGTNFDALMRRCDRWDYSVSANAHSTEVWSRAYPCRYQTLEVGSPRNDRLALARPGDVAAARWALGIDPDRLVVLYVPIPRPYSGAVPFLLDVEELAARLGPNVLLLSRGHHFDAGLTGTATPPGDRVRDVTAHADMEQLLLAADVLITDYSPVMFDYAVLDRPIVIFAPDWDAYRRIRGVVYDVVTDPPGMVVTSLPDLVDAFRNDMITGDAPTKARAQFRERFCYLDDGHAAQRVVDHVFR